MLGSHDDDHDLNDLHQHPIVHLYTKEAMEQHSKKGIPVDVLECSPIMSIREGVRKKCLIFISLYIYNLYNLIKHIRNFDKYKKNEKTNGVQSYQLVLELSSAVSNTKFHISQNL